MTKTKTMTHESYIAKVAQLAARSPQANAADKAMIGRIKLAYGAGPEGVMGVTYYNKWKRGAGKGDAVPFVAVCATCQPEGSYLLAETVIHELGHAISPIGAAHGPVWRAACQRLGLADAKATYQHGDRPAFTPRLLAALERLAMPSEGQPVYGSPLAGQPPGLPGGGLFPPKVRPCTAGWGANGGKSRGPGSGSRNRLWLCACPKPIRVRCAGELKATCGHCFGSFKRADLP